MTIATRLHKESVPQAQQAVAARTAVRFAWVDTLRALLIILVIALHTAITYGAMGDWTFSDPAESEIAGILLTFVTTTVQAFSLGLYFFLSGYFTPKSYDKKGVGGFWKDRLVRLGVPLLLYTFALSRIPNYFAGVAQGYIPAEMTFWSYFAQTFITGADEGPTWFIFALLLFLAGYTLWRLATRSLSEEKFAWMKRLPVPGKLQILAFGLLIGVLMFLVGLVFTVNETVEVFGIFNLMVIFFVQYILAFIAGVLAYRSDWLARFNPRDLPFWRWLTLGLFLLMPVMFFVGGAADGAVDRFTGGPYWQSAMFMLWIGFFSVSISLTLILWLRDRQSQHNRVAAFAGANNYGVYLIHPLVLVPISVAAAALPLHPLLKFVIVLPVVIALCFLIVDALRRIPGVKSVI